MRKNKKKMTQPGSELELVKLSAVQGGALSVGNLLLSLANSSHLEGKDQS
jgi:hypothetical protein